MSMSWIGQKEEEGVGDQKRGGEKWNRRWVKPIVIGLPSQDHIQKTERRDPMGHCALLRWQRSNHSPWCPSDRPKETWFKSLLEGWQGVQNQYVYQVFQAMLRHTEMSGSPVINNSKKKKSTVTKSNVSLREVLFKGNYNGHPWTSDSRSRVFSSSPQPEGKSLHFPEPQCTCA